MFELTERQANKLKVWECKIREKAFQLQYDRDELDEYSVKFHEPYYGAIGGGLTYSFTPTALGTVVKVKEAITGEEIDLTDYDEW